MAVSTGVPIAEATASRFPGAWYGCAVPTPPEKYEAQNAVRVEKAYRGTTA